METVFTAKIRDTFQSEKATLMTVLISVSIHHTKTRSNYGHANTEHTTAGSKIKSRPKFMAISRQTNKQI